MQRTLIAAAAIALLLCAGARAADAPSDAAVAAFRLGQSDVRAFEDYLQPGTCAIVVERARCRQDYAALRAAVGARRGDAQVDEWLALGDRDKRAPWDGVNVPDSAWQSSPVFAWWYTAGAFSVAASLRNDSGDGPYAKSIIRVLSDHVDAAPEAFRTTVSPKMTDGQIDQLAAQIDQTISTSPYPQIQIAGDQIRFAQLGIYLSTMSELVDSPLALARPESRSFALVFFDQVDKVSAEDGLTFSTKPLRQLMTAQVTLDHETLYSAMAPLSSDWIAHLSKKDRADTDALLIGSAIAQTAYNAAVFKDETADETSLRGFLSQKPSFLGISDSARAAISKLLAVPKGRWSDVNEAATAATLAILDQR